MKTVSFIEEDKKKNFKQFRFIKFSLCLDGKIW
jgi:hypothetical protein